MGPKKGRTIFGELLSIGYVYESKFEGYFYHPETFELLKSCRCRRKTTRFRRIIENNPPTLHLSLNRASLEDYLRRQLIKSSSPYLFD